MGITFRKETFRDDFTFKNSPEHIRRFPFPSPAATSGHISDAPEIPFSESAGKRAGGGARPPPFHQLTPVVSTPARLRYS